MIVKGFDVVFKIKIIPTLEPGEVILKEEEEIIYAQSMNDIINFFKEYNIEEKDIN